LTGLTITVNGAFSNIVGSILVEPYTSYVIVVN
jgi:hypothetical protein